MMEKKKKKKKKKKKNEYDINKTRVLIYVLWDNAILFCMFAQILHFQPILDSN